MNMNNRTEEILHYLKMNHTGAALAIHSRDLESRFDLSGRALRRIISSLRQDGVPICSSASGYYYARDQKEINKTVGQLNEFLTGISNARTGLLSARILNDENCKIEIIIKIGGKAV